jgi:hypothetical protein
VIRKRAGDAKRPRGSGSSSAIDLNFSSHRSGAGVPAPRYVPAVLAGSLLTAATLIGLGCHPHMTTAAERGAVVYRTNCIACHNENPNLPGSLGPPIAGAPRALVADRVLHAAYPLGYVPKRHSHIMRPLPWLGPHINDLTAYLDASKSNQG